MVYTCLPICAGAFLLNHIQLPLEHILFPSNIGCYLGAKNFIVRVARSPIYPSISIRKWAPQAPPRLRPSALHLPGGLRGGRERAYAIRLGTHTCEPDSGRTYSSLLPAYVGSGGEWEWVTRLNP